MPADPLEFRIVQNLQTALRAIAEVDGYHHSVAATAVKLDPNVDVEDLLGGTALRPFIVLEVNPDAFDYKPSMRVDIRMPITIHAVHDSDPADDSSWLRTWLRLCADVEQAIAADITRGQLAVDTRALSREFQTFNGQQVWAMVKTEVQIIRTYGAPNG